MIGKICSASTPYYDAVKKVRSIKSRPALIIAGPRNNDYTILPISKISKKEYVDSEYDIHISKVDYPKLNLNHDSYIRVHKQTTVHKNSATRIIADLKGEYEELYIFVLEKLEQYNKEIQNNALN